MLSRSHQVAGACLLGGARALSTASAKLVDDIVGYVRSECMGKPDQAVDVLRSGLVQASQGLQGARLKFAMSEVQCDAGDWESGLQSCRDAAQLLTGQQPCSSEEAALWQQAELEVDTAATRALLVLGRDTKATSCAASVVERARGYFTMPGQDATRWRYLVNSHALQGLVQHAAGDFDSATASFKAAQALVDHVDERRGPPRNQDPRILFALNAAANFQLALGDRDGSLALATRAATAGEAAVAACQGSSDIGSSPELAKECLAGALMCEAQAHMKAAAWEAAEEVLSRAVTAAEAVSGDRHPRVALPLLLTGEVFSRTRRVTYAEGLYRECTKLLHVDQQGRPKGAAHGAPVTVHGVHASALALLAWRFAQLMAALPNRSTELHEWDTSAVAYYSTYRQVDGGAGDALGDELGPLEALKGKHGWGMGVVLDTWSRRALPCE